MGSSLRKESARYTFRFVGKQGDLYALRAPIWSTKNRNCLDAQQFEGEVAGFLMENAKGKWYVSSFKNTPGYADMPHAFENATSLCILLESPADMIAFEQAFEVEQDLSEIVS